MNDDNAVSPGRSLMAELTALREEMAEIRKLVESLVHKPSDEDDVETLRSIGVL